MDSQISENPTSNIKTCDLRPETFDQIRGRMRSLVRAVEGLQRLVFHQQAWKGRRTLGRFPEDHEAMMDAFFEAIALSTLNFIQMGKQLVTQRVDVLATVTGKMLAAVPDDKGCFNNRVCGPFDAAHADLVNEVIEAVTPYLGPLFVRVDDHHMAPGIMKVITASWGGREEKELKVEERVES